MNINKESSTQPKFQERNPKFIFWLQFIMQFIHEFILKRKKQKMNKK